MAWLALACLMSFGFGQLFKWSQRKNCHGPTVVTANYLVLAAALGVYLGLSGHFELSRPVLEIGVLTGAFFIVAMIVLTQALATSEVGAVLTAFRLSILLPILLGVWLWHEHVTAMQGSGVALALVGLVLMTLGQKGAGPVAPFSAKALALLLLVFFSQSLSHVGLSSVHYMDLDAQKLSVLFATASAAGLIGAAAVAFKRHRPTRGEAGMGALIGVYNMLNLIVILIALSLVPRTVYFPVSGCAVVIMDNLFAHFFWKERLRLPGMVGAALGAAAMLLVFP
ncbi:MAG: hypothetical protein HY291_19125 [Planctomycetes bacterium]|nr:hypothetical protein [Planctomycetota bacterium]